MPVFGNNNPTWTGAWSFYSSNGQCGGDFVVPAGATYLTGLGGYVAGDENARTVVLACWRGNTVIASKTGSPAQAGFAGVGSQGWQTCTFTDGDIAITPGETLRLGWARSQTNGYYDWSTSAGGTWYGQNNGSPGTWSGTSSNAGTIGAYGVYSTSGGGGGAYNIFINGTQVPANNVLINGAAAQVFINGSQL